MKPARIERFRGEHAFLSNFFPARIEHEGIVYPSVEHAYQAAKTLNRELRERIARLESPGQAKRMGRTVDLQPGWEHMKVAVMTDLVRRKFQDPTLTARLLGTGEAELIETNDWGDTVWGVSRGSGRNLLGQILMDIRAELRAGGTAASAPEAARFGPADAARVEALCRAVLDGNRQRGISQWGGRAYDFVCPSPGHYPFQWLWDSSFHAIALLHHDPERAKGEITCLFQGVQDDGFLPHMLLWEKSAHEAALRDYAIRLADPFFTATIQPPVFARSLARIHEHTGDDAFIRAQLPAALAVFEWWARQRDPDGDGLVSIIQPDESGLDASPKFDALMGIDLDPARTLPSLQASMADLMAANARIPRAEQARSGPFSVEEVMTNVIYLDGLGHLARLCRTVAGDRAAAERLEERRLRGLAALVRKCWDDEAGCFWDLAGIEETRLRTLTFTSLFPLVLPDLPAEMARRLVEEHLISEQEFWTAFPVPSTAASEPAYDPAWRTNTTWRGPAWVNANWYLYWGLRAHGYRELARTLALRTVQMVATGGVREFFDPLTGTGQGAHDFGWTTLALDLMAAEGLLAPRAAAR